MKVLVVSDIHGNSDNFRKVVNFYFNENIDKMIILGDTFSSGYELTCDNVDIQNLLYDIGNNLIMIRGNCDNDFDNSLTPCGMLERYEMVIGSKRYYFHHGHLRTRYSSSIYGYVQGHTHVIRLDENDGVLFLNPGSLGRPRDYTDGSFMVIGEHSITIFDIHFNVIMEKTIL